ncbi:MAG TPA: GFA family protein [Sphingomonadaceae bacterium]
MPKRAMSGGCQCGKVRYTAQVDPEEAYLCHCRMCQRATGGVAAAFVGLSRADCAWASEPDWYASSPIAQRPFCSNCGTPLGFRYLEGETMDLTVGSFDDPYVFAPHWHFGAETIHEDWLDTSELPRKNAADYPVLVEKWLAATGKMPE